MLSKSAFMKRSLSFCCSVIAIFTIGIHSSQAQVSARTAGYKTDTEYNPGVMAKDILYYINQHRASIGLSKLELSPAATEQAVKHSEDMANGSLPFGHDGFEDRMNAIMSKVGRLSESAENVAAGAMSAREVVDGWLKSQGHKENIEGDYKYTGIGLAKASDGHIYFTQIFYRQ